MNPEIAQSVGMASVQDLHLQSAQQIKPETTVHNRALVTGHFQTLQPQLSLSEMESSRNRLEGDISFLLGKNKSMNTAYFSRNLFEFDFSRVELSEKLRNLDLNHNKIFGRLPAQMEQMSWMNASYNRLCGRIPVTGRLQELDYTAFFHNKPLPECKRLYVVSAYCNGISIN